MSHQVGAVRGNREEINPNASVYNWIGSLEWNAPPGECDAFGGDVLIRRSILEETGGYDEVLVGGEDPELSQRVRLKGWKIIQLDEPMTRHDLAMTKVSQYWRRCFRTGYGFAAVTARFGTKTKGFWLHELIRIMIRGGGFLGFALLALPGMFFSPWAIFFLLPGLLLLFFPRIFRLSYFMKDKGLSRGQAKTYALHCSLIVVPEFFGLARFLWGQVTGNPLRNKRSVLGTGMTVVKEGSMGVTKKVVYLASEYPGISHTFIFREVHSLRQQGFHVMTASIRRPGNLEKMTATEKEDAAKNPLYKGFVSYQGGCFPPGPALEKPETLLFYAASDHFVFANGPQEYPEIHCLFCRGRGPDQMDAQSSNDPRACAFCQSGRHCGYDCRCLRNHILQPERPWAGCFL